MNKNIKQMSCHCVHFIQTETENLSPVGLSVGCILFIDCQVFVLYISLLPLASVPQVSIDNMSTNSCTLNPWIDVSYKYKSTKSTTWRHRGQDLLQPNIMWTLNYILMTWFDDSGLPKPYCCFVV